MRRLASVGSVVLLFALACCGSEGGTSPSGSDADAGIDVNIDAAPRDDAGSDASDASDADASDVSPPEPPVVQVIPGVVVDTFAGSATGGDAEGTGTAAQFSNPVGIAVDGAGLLVTEYDRGRLRRVSAGRETSVVATGLHQAFGVTVAPDAIFVQTDQDENGAKGPTSGTIWRVPNAGTPEVVVTGLGRPRGLARLADGRIVLSDRMRHTVSILDPTDGNVTLLAGAGTVGFADGSGAAARFDNPYGAALLPDGSIVVADAGNHCIRKVTLAGEVTLFAGDRNQGMKDHPDRLKARFNLPTDIAVDDGGNVYVSDRGNHRIRRISTTGAVETVAGDGSLGFADGAGATAKFFGQEGIDVSGDGKTIYVADGTSGDPEPYHRIRRIVLP